MTIRTILCCWLCRKPFDLRVELYPGAELGAARYWCRECTRPRFFSKRLRERMAALEAESTTLLGEDAELWNALGKVLAFEEAFEENRAETLAA